MEKEKENKTRWERKEKRKKKKTKQKDAKRFKNPQVSMLLLARASKPHFQIFFNRFLLTLPQEQSKSESIAFIIFMPGNQWNEMKSSRKVYIYSNYYCFSKYKRKKNVASTGKLQWGSAKNVNMALTKRDRDLTHTISSDSDQHRR